MAFKEALKPEFKVYQKRIVANAKKLSSELSSRGFRIVSGGTDNHLMLVDLSNKGVSGKEAEILLDKAGITVNKNLIPFDEKSPFVTSGVRLGTPAVTTRGMGEKEMAVIASLIDRAISVKNDDEKLAAIRGEVKEMLKLFPLYADWIKEMENIRK